jgi:PAS domain-containing protein
MFPHEIPIRDSHAPAFIPEHGHAVQFYETDKGLIKALAQHFGPALVAGGSAIVVATPTHLRDLSEELAARGVDLESARATHRYIELDAAETLERIMLHGWPDPDRFKATVGQLIARTEALAEERRVLVFGEMVALLWNEGRHEATLRLEQIWNDFAENHRLFLICGYPLNLFSRSDHRKMFFNICGEHTHINPADSYLNIGNRRRSSTRRPEKAGTLANEIRISQERTLLLQSATSAGTWELDLGADIFSLTSAAAKLLGIPSGRAALSSIVGQMYYSGDREALASVLDQARKGRRSFAVAFRVWNGEIIRLLEMRGKAFSNAGSPIMIGVLLDVTPADNAAA